MKTIFIPIFIFCILCGSPPNEVTAQNTALNVELRFGLNLNLYNFNPFTSKNQKFSGLKVFGTAIVAGQISPELRSNYAATIAIYNKSLGNNMNPLISDIQIDFINSLSLGVGWGKGAIWQRDFWKNEQPMVPYSKYLRTMNQAPFYNLNHNFRNAAFLGTNFIINNHGRNQTCGSIALTFGDFSLNYYNDGSFPFSTLSLSDGFDRYWTGGLLLMGHNNRGYNNVEFSFDQFTGYRKLVYELSNLLNMRVPEYQQQETFITGKAKNSTGNMERHSSSSFNSSAYNLKVYLSPNYAFDIGIIGSLMKEERYYGLQDLIHINGKMPLHPNRDINRLYIGLTYNQLGYEF